MNLVSFEDVGVTLSGEQILSGVSFEVGQGELHFIIGPNGGGKTTVIRALLGQIPYRGKITVNNGQDTVVGYVPQSIQLDRNIPVTVRDVLMVMQGRRPTFMGATKAVRHAQDRLLERIGIAGKADAVFGELSGGERQRVLFAQALSPTPQLLIMDEPTSNMDQVAARQLELVVGELQEQGTTILWINHDWAQVARMAGRATFINRTVLDHGASAQVVAGQAAA